MSEVKGNQVEKSSDLLGLPSEFKGGWKQKPTDSSQAGLAVVWSTPPENPWVSEKGQRASR